MIYGNLDSVSEKHFGYLFGFVPTQAINNATFVRTLVDEFQNGSCLVFLLIASSYIQTQIRTVKRRYECFRFLQCELVHDVLSCDFVRRSGKGDNRHFWELLANGFQLGIFRSEVMSPLGNAMCFVYGEQGNPDVFQKKIQFCKESFWGNVEKFDFPLQTFPS